ncbi:MAG: (Fe-S)-binding protein, partial [Planctomycetia bacterium]|nr:(Fe-S)-binding protein [Planctomycetia bacterium]
MTSEKIVKEPYVPGEPVTLFVPCYIDQFYPQIAIATAKILKKYGIPLLFPEHQTCCGQPAFNSGYQEEAGKVIRHFCECMKGAKWIVSPSGSCTAMGRVFFEKTLPHEPLVGDVASRMFELGEFLVEHLGVTDVGATFPHRCTMHVGCHTRRELGVADASVTLLKNVRDVEYVELPDMEDCCGFGGTFSVKMPGTSIAMGKTKVDNILKTRAEYVVTPDISCAMHFGGILEKDPRGA